SRATDLLAAQASHSPRRHARRASLSALPPCYSTPGGDFRLLARLRLPPSSPDAHAVGCPPAAWPLMSSGPPPIIASMRRPPVRRKRTTSTPVRSRKARFNHVV